MADKKAISKQVLEFAAGMATELLYTVFLIAAALVISALVTRWL